MVAAGRNRRSFATGCCASTPADRTGWSMGITGRTLLNADHRQHWRRLLRPARSRRSNVRWRRKAGGSWRRSPSRSTRPTGFAKISGCRATTRKTSWPSRLRKKTAELAKIRARLPKGVEIELWWQDEARIGQKNKLTRRGQTWHAPAGAPRPAHRMGLYLRRDLSREGEGRRAGHALVRTDAMAAHLIVPPDPGAKSIRHRRSWRPKGLPPSWPKVGNLTASNPTKTSSRCFKLGTTSSTNHEDHVPRHAQMGAWVLINAKRHTQSFRYSHLLLAAVGKKPVISIRCAVFFGSILWRCNNSAT